MANIWKQFEDLLQKDATQVAEVVAVNPNSVTVELLSGDRLNVRAAGIDVAATDMVYIKGGVISEKAPVLPRHDLILY
ncbi:hypothetical protein [Marinobacterium stanieri]|uniref:hypothetical protein n=1 Tax=Marinobacterium stanieri TaxID=49186 RepID=UPI000255A17B|nr:hypothetical protein [Marinobacterium stanieri]